MSRRPSGADGQFVVGGEVLELRAVQRLCGRRGRREGVVVNEQVCDANELVGRTLHVTINKPGDPVFLDLIVAESRAGNDVCPCP